MSWLSPLPMLEKQRSPSPLCLLHLPEALHRGPVCSLPLQTQLSRLLEPGSQPRGLQALWIEGQGSPCSVTDHSTVLAAAQRHLPSLTAGCGNPVLGMPCSGPTGNPVPHMLELPGSPRQTGSLGEGSEGKLAPFPQGFPSLPLHRSGRAVTGIPCQML